MVRAELLETVGFEFIDIQEFYSELLPNKHGRAIIGGTISGTKYEKYQNLEKRHERWMYS